MELSASFSTSVKPARSISELPVFSLGQASSVAVKYANRANTVIDIDDPKTSQLTRVKLLRGTEEMGFFLNPGRRDSAGTLFAPEARNIRLQGGSGGSFEIEMSKLCLEELLAPGFYGLVVVYGTVESNQLRFGLEFNEGSIGPLMEIALNEDLPQWPRERALRWLQKLPVTFELVLSPESEGEGETRRRVERNTTRAQTFLKQVQLQLGSEKFKAVFDSERLRSQPGK